ncbi:Cu(I)/Ag(I) efflux system membrane fusion protein [Flavobacterium sp. CG_23.5]|uniref:efflux RND transporter periplasmic adaptor subunit n=1 Tax=unclassified Flavobacterium TaxID=196869 RepID=UPI0018C98A13|nr:MULTISPECIES: efflux RND transporter periplasmic adaptor subunit [unclassified Flavobacterium]MBG6110453.1 Cu(I)/Ag(I) efflux system membrane fusion protein [Flavobacterium sp. CG_9.10]MBP2284120.1 Cu(I)/Ag(I) efflux system membrane fusion protein [Flavobacterium sp. CG_23.5]
MNKYLKYSLVVLVISIIGITTYYFINKSNTQSNHGHQKELYTCPMHPQIIRDKPGNCPICGMALVKKTIRNQAVNSKSIEDLLTPTDNFIVGNYQTTTPKDTAISSEMSLPGIVTYDPNAGVNVAARISGRIEKMYVNYKYQKVNKGQKLFDLYSPELLTEQQNFIYLITNDADNTSIIKASKQKLVLYGMTNNQINSLVSTRRSSPVISIYSPAFGIIQGTESMTKSAESPMQNSSGTTENLTVKEGDYIKKNQVVFKLVNTDKVWAIFNVLQGYNSLIKTNQSIRISSELDENDFIDAKVNFIETQFNPTDKSNRIRVYLNNNTLKFPIGLRLQGIVETNPIQGIWLQKQALVSIGSKKIVFIKMNNGFKVREIKTGIEINDFVQIIDGISVQDTIAENGQYLIDSESFIKTE